MTPALDGPVNRGHACVKGRFAHAFARSADRLTRPLVRRDGRLQPATWEEALGLVGRELQRTIAQRGPDSVAAISSARATNEENYLLQKLMRMSSVLAMSTTAPGCATRLRRRALSQRLASQAVRTPSTTSTGPTASCLSAPTPPRRTLSSVRASSSWSATAPGWS